MTAIKLRNVNLDEITIAHGSHSAAAAHRDKLMCAMEWVAFLAGEPHSDAPRCASKVITGFVVSWNDAMSDEDRQILKPLLPRIVGTAATPEIELERSWLALDWTIRESAPIWLDLAKLSAHAKAPRGCAPVRDAASAAAAQPLLDAAYKAARAAWDAAWAAARAAARAAAWDAAWAAARAAAWDAAGAAARDAARDAAWAAAGAAARDAAGAALRPTVVALQQSAVGLLERLIDCGKEESA